MGALVLLVSACSAAVTPTSDATDPPASPTEAATASATAAEATPEPSASETAEASVHELWVADAVEHRAMIGQEFEYDCPAGGVGWAIIWGTDTYTDDSSVCTAGVHRGVITLEEGGTVTIEMRPGEDQYEGTERNGIESSAYPAWGGSFVIIDD